MNEKQKPDQIRIADLELNVGTAQELPVKDRIRWELAQRVLLVLAIIFIFSSYMLVYGPVDRLAQAQAVFEFVKTIVPAIATLVLGFYYRNESR